MRSSRASKQLRLGIGRAKPQEKDTGLHSSEVRGGGGQVKGKGDVIMFTLEADRAGQTSNDEEGTGDICNLG